MWIEFVVVFTVVVGITMAAALRYGRRQWTQFGESLHARLGAARVPSKVKVVDFAEIDSLPSPVQRYLRRVDCGKPARPGYIAHIRYEFSH